MTNTDNADMFEALVIEGRGLGYEVCRQINEYGYILGYIVCRVGSPDPHYWFGGMTQIAELLNGIKDGRYHL